MKYTEPFFVKGVKVSVHNKRLIRFYHTGDEISETEKMLFDIVAQYLMDEHFITANECRVEVVCTGLSE
jgi:hypothetical protein